MSVELLVAIALSYLSGFSYLNLVRLDVVSETALYKAVWFVVDAICACAVIEPFHFPKTVGGCDKLSADWKVSELHRAER